MKIPIIRKNNNFDGQKFGKLTIIRFSHQSKSKKGYLLCLCDCGNEGTYDSYRVRSGKTSSCGCIQKVSLGMHRSAEYRAWISMNQRCYDKNHKQYKRYGGRGIDICDKWRFSFIEFYNDMKSRPKGMSLDRIDNNKGYSKENCRWTNKENQSNNRENNIYYSFNGDKKTIPQIAKYLNISKNALRQRLKSGLSLENALKKPFRKRKWAKKPIQSVPIKRTDL